MCVCLYINQCVPEVVLLLCERIVSCIVSLSCAGIVVITYKQMHKHLFVFVRRKSVYFVAVVIV